MQKLFIIKAASKCRGEFTMIEVMLANTILVILVVGFANVTEKTLEQMQLRLQRAKLASELENWTLSKLNATLITGTY